MTITDGEHCTAWPLPLTSTYRVVRKSARAAAAQGHAREQAFVSRSIIRSRQHGFSDGTQVLPLDVWHEHNGKHFRYGTVVPDVQSCRESALRGVKVPNA